MVSLSKTYASRLLSRPPRTLPQSSQAHLRGRRNIDMRRVGEKRNRAMMTKTTLERIMSIGPEKMAGPGQGWVAELAQDIAIVLAWRKTIGMDQSQMADMAHGRITAVVQRVFPDTLASATRMSQTFRRCSSVSSAASQTMQSSASR